MDHNVKDEYYRLMFENSMDAILLTSPDGRIFQVNPAGCELLQQTQDDLRSQGRSGIADPNDPRWGVAFAEQESTGKVRTELNVIRKDGRVIPTESTSAVFHDLKGQRWTVDVIRDVSVFKDRENALKMAREEAERYAAYDYLTNILNRRTFLMKFQQEIYRAKREKKPIGLLMLDIDFFKKINDEMGHKAGDAVLRHFSQKISENIRPYDIFGRYGGDEFIICLPNTRYEEAYKVANRLRNHIEKANLYYDVRPLKLTSSIGVGCCEYETNEDPNELIHQVDQYLYKAKKMRNSVYGQAPIAQKYSMN